MLDTTKFIRTDEDLHIIVLNDLDQPVGQTQTVGLNQTSRQNTRIDQNMTAEQNLTMGQNATSVKNYADQFNNSIKYVKNIIGNNPYKVKNYV